MITKSDKRNNLEKVFDKFDSIEKLKSYIEKEYEKYKGVLA